MAADGYEYLPLPAPLEGGWLVAGCVGTDWNDGDGVPAVSVGWTADGTSGGYRRFAVFATMRESGIALDALASFMAAEAFPDRDRTLEAAGFAGVEPQGLSATGRPTWRWEIGDRWFCWFGDLPGETRLSVADRSVVPHRISEIGLITPPSGPRAPLPYRSGAPEAALLAVLAARIEAGDPGAPLA